jgi:hypothetical protein
MRERALAVTSEPSRNDFEVEPGKTRLLVTRDAVVKGWLAVMGFLLRKGRPELATQVQRFVSEMPPRIDKEGIAAELHTHANKASVQRPNLSR